MNDLNDYNYYYFLGMAHGFGNSGDLLLPRFALRPANDARLARLVAAMGLYNAHAAEKNPAESQSLLELNFN